jgi:hypothetical protein
MACSVGWKQLAQNGVQFRILLKASVSVSRQRKFPIPVPHWRLRIAERTTFRSKSYLLHCSKTGTLKTAAGYPQNPQKCCEVFIFRTWHKPKILCNKTANSSLPTTQYATTSPPGSTPMSINQICMRCDEYSSLALLLRTESVPQICCLPFFL